MNPVEQIVDESLCQALRCVEYRAPRPGKLKKPGYTLSLALRYAVIGSAAAHYVLANVPYEAHGEALRMLQRWPDFVEEHVRWSMLERFPFDASAELAGAISRLSAPPFNRYILHHRRFAPLETTLILVADRFTREHEDAIRDGWLWFFRNRAYHEFRAASEQSISFALHFYERRVAQCEEVPEITLIGE